MAKHLPGCNHFSIAFPDPGPDQDLCHSVGLSNEEIIRQGLQPFQDRRVLKEEVATTTFHRAFGGNGSVSSVYRPVKSNKPAYLVVKASS